MFPGLCAQCEWWCGVCFLDCMLSVSGGVVCVSWTVCSV